MLNFESEQVQQFYDRNTRWMLLFGRGDGSIHRAVWGPGVHDRRAAMGYVDEMLIERLRHVETRQGDVLRVVDLGSGVGASLCRIAQALPVQAIGITISRTQAELAERRARALGLSDRVCSVQADFCALPTELGPADAAFGIESFVHARDPVAFFREAARLLRPGGLLMLCDDFLGPNAAASQRARGWVDRFARGWVLSSLATPEQVDAWAADAGFSPEESLDLTMHLRLGRPRDWLVALFARGLRWLPLPGRYSSMLRGGDALQVCLARGWVQYRLMTWRKTG